MGQKLHSLNPFNAPYNFDELTKINPNLSQYLMTKNERTTLDFSLPNAVLELNRSLLMNEFKITDWNIPKGSLCPPIPGRTDYICYLHQLIGHQSGSKILDIGTGSNAVYPIIGNALFNWEFVATDNDDTALTYAKKNTVNLPGIEIRKQSLSNGIFKGVIEPGEYYQATICNPPFFDSAEAALKANQRKNKNLHGTRATLHNFGGENNELWTPGGEKRFIGYMIKESSFFADQVGWFTTLVSNKDHLPIFKKWLEKVNATEVKIINMQQGNKVSRILAWRF